MKNIAFSFLIFIFGSINVTNADNCINIIYENKGIYIGQMQKQNKSGIGFYIYNNSDIYYGEWNNNVYNGYGRKKIRDRNCNLCDVGINYKIVDGFWKNGQLLTGENKSNLSFESDEFNFKIGIIVNHKLQGFGIREDGMSNYYIGNFVDDILTGEGVVISKDPLKYFKHGIWKNYQMKKINKEYIFPEILK